MTVILIVLGFLRVAAIGRDELVDNPVIRLCWSPGSPRLQTSATSISRTRNGQGA
jgi:hypothetical protein